jgi:hypothetical protein
MHSQIIPELQPIFQGEPLPLKMSYMNPNFKGFSHRPFPGKKNNKTETVVSTNCFGSGYHFQNSLGHAI